MWIYLDLFLCTIILHTSSALITFHQKDFKILISGKWATALLAGHKDSVSMMCTFHIANSEMRKVKFHGIQNSKTRKPCTNYTFLNFTFPLLLTR